MNLQDKVRDTIKSAISAGEFLTLKEIAARSSCSIRTAHTVRTFLVASGEIPPRLSPRHGGRPKKSRPLDIPTPPLGGLFDMEGLSTEQQRSILSQLIVSSPNDAIKVAAQNALTRLDSISGSSVNLGPGAPLSESDRVNRLSTLMSACGLVTVRTALKLSFPKSFARYDEALTGEENEDPPGA